MEQIKILSDYTPADEPNILTVIYDDQGDVHLGIFEGNDNERGIRIAASGSRHQSTRILNAFRELIQAYKEEVQSEDCHPDLRSLNERSVNESCLRWR